MSSSKSRNTREISDIFHFAAIHFLPEQLSAMVLNGERVNFLVIFLLVKC